MQSVQNKQSFKIFLKDPSSISTLIIYSLEAVFCVSLLQLRGGVAACIQLLALIVCNGLVSGNYHLISQWSCSALSFHSVFVRAKRHLGAGNANKNSHWRSFILCQQPRDDHWGLITDILHHCQLSFTIIKWIFTAVKKTFFPPSQHDMRNTFQSNCNSFDHLRSAVAVWMIEMDSKVWSRDGEQKSRWQDPPQPWIKPSHKNCFTYFKRYLIKPFRR